MYLILFIYFYLIVEWTVTLTRYLKEQLLKVQDYYQNQSQDLLMTEDQKLALKQWNYCTRLAKYLYEVNYHLYLFGHNVFKISRVLLMTQYESLEFCVHVAGNVCDSFRNSLRLL